jgi:hypothetical protein
LLAQLHAHDLAYHFHGDHFLALLLKYSAEQLNTLVNFESALLGLDGQFSVGGNTLPSAAKAHGISTSAWTCPPTGVGANSAPTNCANAKHDSSALRFK